MKLNKMAAALALSGAAVFAHADSIPSVVVTVENSAPARGALQTPVWIGIHDGSFDIYDRDVPLGAEGLVSGAAVEALAEDGATGPISQEFANLQPGSPQATLLGTAGPLVPGQGSSTTLQVDPEVDRYFSYASMVIPSNDAFIANGNPLAHQIFDDRGRFVADDFVVAGTQVLDAGTEVNDEIAANTAFLNQAAPNTGVTEGGNVVIHPGFLTEGVTFPDGVLNHPVFGLADFTSPTYRAASVNFRYIDLGVKNLFFSRLTRDQEVTGGPVVGNASGGAIAVTKYGRELFVKVVARHLTGPIQMAHLHLGAPGSNGPVVANMTDDVTGRRVRSFLDAADVVGPLAEADDPFLALLNELAAGNIYINLHTEANPAGELRGQIRLR